MRGRCESTKTSYGRSPPRAPSEDPPSPPSYEMHANKFVTARMLNVLTKIRNGAPSQKECVANGQMTNACIECVCPSPSPTPPPRPPVLSHSLPLHSSPATGRKLGFHERFGVPSFVARRGLIGWNDWSVVGAVAAISARRSFVAVG